MLWLNDPKTKEASVSLTTFVASFLLLIIVSVLQMLGKVESVGAFQELLYTTAALYFGRRFSFGNKTFGSDSAPQNSVEPK